MLVDVYKRKGTATPMAHIDPVFNLRFLENMGLVLYNEGYQMIELFILLFKWCNPPPPVQDPICCVNFFYEYKVMLISNTCI